MNWPFTRNSSPTKTTRSTIPPIPIHNHLQLCAVRRVLETLSHQLILLPTTMTWHASRGHASRTSKTPGTAEAVIPHFTLTRLIKKTTVIHVCFFEWPDVNGSPARERLQIVQIISCCSVSHSRKPSLTVTACPLYSNHIDISTNIIKRTIKISYAHSCSIHI